MKQLFSRSVIRTIYGSFCYTSLIYSSLALAPSSFASTIPIGSTNIEEEQILAEQSLETLTNLPFVEIATGTAVPLEKAPAVATLITADDIKAMGALTLDEVLESVPGLHIIPSTLNRMTPIYTFRGLYSGFNAQVLFLWNGVPIVGDLFNHSMSHLSMLNVENIQRIEVVRGPGSAIYGADAYAGVINIISKSAQDLNGFHAGLRVGTQNSKNIWLQYGGPLNEQWDIASHFEFFSRDSDSSRMISSDSQTQWDQLFGSSASLAPGHIEDRFRASSFNIQLTNKHWKIAFNSYMKNDSGLGAGASQTLDPMGHDRYEQYLLSLTYENSDWRDNWNFKTDFSYFYSDNEPELNLFPSGTLLPVGNDGNIFTPHNGVGCTTNLIPGLGCLTQFSGGYIGRPGMISEIPELSGTLTYSGWTDHEWRFNLGIKYEKSESYSKKNFGPGVLDTQTLNGQPNPPIVDGHLVDVTGTPNIYISNNDRSIKYFSLQDIWNLHADWTVTAGIRYDHYSDFGSTINPRLALVWTPTAQMVAKLLYGRAFRPPSFSELYSQNNPVVIGNRGLDAETINTTELAISYEFTSDLNMDLSIYHYQARDMIEFIPNPDGTRTAQNHRDLNGKGMEWETTWQLNRDWHLSAHYAYQETRDMQTDQQLEYVPKQQAHLDLRWQLDSHWSLSGQLSWIGDRQRGGDDTRNDIDDYELVNLILRGKDLSFFGDAKNWEIAASVKNLFDQKAYEPSNGIIADDYPLHERRLYAEVRYHFNER